MSISVEKVKKSELTLLSEIGRDTFFESFGHQNNPSDMEIYLESKFNFEQISNEWNNSESEFYFLRNIDQVIGYLKVNSGKAQSEHFENSLEIERIYIKSEFQGQGLGQKLFEKAMEIARELCVSSMWLGVWDKNRNAVRFYERQGFSQFDTHEFLLGEDLQTDIMMRLNL